MHTSPFVPIMMKRSELAKPPLGNVINGKSGMLARIDPENKRRLSSISHL